MSHTDEVEIPVTDEADVVLAGRRAKVVLEDLAFDEAVVEEIVLVVHELASNIVKHAGEGTVTIEPRSSPAQTGIEIRARDTGPGIDDVDRAVVDGYSTADSIGGGLGTVHRLMDEVVIKSADGTENGIQVVARRWIGGDTSDAPNPVLKVGAVTRPKPGYEQNGDAFLVEHESDRTLVGVIDGLGHGSEAYRASDAARRYIQRHATASLTDLFDGAEQACRPTRGVVMALARIDWEEGHVMAGSVGNITVRECHSSEPRQLVSRRGVIGGNAPNPLLTDWQWDPRSVMVIHSDGVGSQWECNDFRLRDDRTATAIAQEILRTHSEQDDDATVLVVGGIDR